MNKPIIGIVSNRNFGETNRPFTYTTNFSNLVAEKIYSNNALPIGVIFPYGVYEEETLKQCDGLVLQGGNRIELCQLLTVGYALKNNIPILGICNGMQTMAGFDYLSQQVSIDEPYFYHKISTLYSKLGEEAFLSSCDDHNKENPFYIQSLELAKHKVYFNEDSEFFDYYNTYIINALSLHNYACNKSIFDNSNYFKISGLSEDGVVEAIESKNESHLAIGVQYHLEIDDQGDPIFSDLVEEAKYIRKYKK
ncbi:MAG: gamma-glutamyl-gamma-aminobutyrate hydrolase family protein [Bacilli bacterium]|nr:gamma-glutamyl-gamma-aminobutyrate hydrolase family protein [Bacilli bacterium]